MSGRTSKAWWDGQSELKLNLGCGRNIKPGWVNIDSWKRADVDLEIDLSTDFPFEPKSCQFIYSEHFLEHLDWLATEELIAKSFTALRKNGVFRAVIPNFQRVFEAYVQGDRAFLENCGGLLQDDYLYYKSVYEEPERVVSERTNNPPPDWHVSQKPEDRRNVKLRAREYTSPIEIVDWVVHQYGEHKTLYDSDSLIGTLKRAGFSKAYRSSFDVNLDSSAYFVPASLYIEAIV
jgi:hypothetical protein